jgi:hypothetical protein
LRNKDLPVRYFGINDLERSSSTLVLSGPSSRGPVQQSRSSTAQNFILAGDVKKAVRVSGPSEEMGWQSEDVRFTLQGFECYRLAGLNNPLSFPCSLPA